MPREDLERKILSEDSDDISGALYEQVSLMASELAASLLVIDTWDCSKRYEAVDDRRCSPRVWGSSWSSYRRRYSTKLLGDMRDAKIRQVFNINHSVSTCLQDPVDSTKWSEGAHSPPESTWIVIGTYESCQRSLCMRTER